MGNIDIETDVSDAAATADQDKPRKLALARVGTVLRGKWRLDALLGLGGMAAVYAASHRNGTRAAVKMLHRDLCSDERLRQRFLREGVIANLVGHEGAVKVIDDDTAEDGSVYLVTELLEGETLEDYCVRRGGILGEAEVLRLVDALLDVLVAAHAKDLVHRDLKPANVFLTTTGQVKVLDFGIARARALVGQSQATAAGMQMGTPAYMAPEQARGLTDEIDGRTDLWACGATMYRLLSGRVVHEGRTASEQLLGAMTRPAQPLMFTAPHVSPHVAAIVDRALAFDRNERWADAAAMQAAVRDAGRHLPVTSAQAPSTIPDPRPPSEQPSEPVVEDAPLRVSATMLAAGARRPAAPATPVAVPVSTLASEPPPEPEPSRIPGKRGRVVHVVAVVGAVACVAGGWLAFAHAGGEGSATPAVDSARPPATTAPVPMPPQTAKVTAAASTTAPVAAPGTPSATETASATPSAGRVAWPRAPATTTPKLNCSPPYVVDPATGKKNWKAECL